MTHLLARLHASHERSYDRTFSPIEWPWLSNKHVIVGIHHFRVRHYFETWSLNMGALTKDRIKLFDRSLLKFYHIFFVCRLVSSHSWIMLTVTVLKSCRIFNYAIFAFFFHILIQVRTFIVYILHSSERILPYGFTKLIFSLRRIEIIRDLINYSKLLCCEDTLLKIAF